MFAWQAVLDEKLRFVRRYCEIGFQILPLHGIHEGKCTCDEDCRHPGKHPLLPSGVYSASNDYDWLKDIFQAHPWSNIGGAPGKKSGNFNLDLDSQDAIDEARRLVVPKTWAFSTGKGEQHMFAYPDLRENLYVQNAVQVANGMDIRSDGGYSVLPPSIHYTGHQYQWLVAPWEHELAAAPGWLNDKLIIKNKSAAPDFDEEEPQELMTEGGRNDYLFRTGCSLRAKGLSSDELRLVLTERNARACNPPLTDQEVMDICASIAARYTSGETGARALIAKQVEQKIGSLQQLPELLLTAPMTDAGNAECLVELFVENFRSSRAIAQRRQESKGIFYFNGTVWQEDVEREFRDRAKWTARGRARIAEQAETRELRRQMYKHALTSENLGKLEAACELASTDYRLIVPAGAWDADQWVLGLVNGTLDLRTGVFREAKSDDYITTIAPVRYDAEASAPLWEKTIAEVFVDNQAIIPYFRRWCGYILTGDTSEHKVPIWYGPGGNGKSTIGNTLMALLGGFAGAATLNMFDDRAENERNDALAGLRGKRFVLASESEATVRIAEAKIKAVVSGDPIRCRFLNNNFFEYRPAFKVVIATNYLPLIKGSDSGIWRRIDIVPFNQTFTGERRDKNLEHKLRRELPGILNWCLAGLREYFEMGLASPSEVQYSTEQLRDALDSFTQWFDERLVKGDGYSLRKGEAYIDYRTWMKNNGDGPLNRVRWSDRMEKVGIQFADKISQEAAAKGWRLQAYEVY